MPGHKESPILSCEKDLPRKEAWFGKVKEEVQCQDTTGV